MPKLTLAEQRIIKHPPTRGTWKCQAKRQTMDDGEYTCSAVMTTGLTTCNFCGASKPRRPLMLWPIYEAACKKAGVPTIEEIVRLNAECEGASAERVKPTRVRRGR